MCPVWESTNRKRGRNLKHDIIPSREPGPLLYFSRSKTDIYISKLKLFAMIKIKSIPSNTLSKTLSTVFIKNKYLGFVLTFVWFYQEAVPPAQPCPWMMKVGMLLLSVQGTTQGLYVCKRSYQEGSPALELLEGERKKNLCLPSRQISLCPPRGVERGSPCKAENLISYFHCVLFRVLFSLPALC